MSQNGEGNKFHCTPKSYLSIQQSKPYTAHEFDGVLPARVGVVVHPAQHGFPHRFLALDVQLVLQYDAVQLVDGEMQELVALCRHRHEVTEQVPSRFSLQFVAKYSSENNLYI